MNKNFLKIIKYIDYCYINNYLKNNLKIINVNCDENMNDWKIFSTYSNDEKFNILYLIQMICSQIEFDYEIFLISIHIYKKICIKYAHIIDNYVYLFGSIYVVINKLYCKKYLTDKFLIKIFNIEQKIITIMISCIEKFLTNYEIYFGNNEKNKIMNEICLC
jgi:hypothetical protein